MAIGARTFHHCPKGAPQTSPSLLSKVTAFVIPRPHNAANLPGLAAGLVTMNVDVIFASSSTYVEPARQAPSKIPIVFASHADPVGVGHVASLSRPGGNITGLSMLMTDLAVKELELLKEALPQAMRFGVLWNPTTPFPALRAVNAAGEKLGVELLAVPARTIEDFGGAFSEMTRENALMVFSLLHPHSAILAARPWPNWHSSTGCPKYLASERMRSPGVS
jgi:ABC-type uncharacterized transport system substrate-binding protein